MKNLVKALTRTWDEIFLKGNASGNLVDGNLVSSFCLLHGPNTINDQALHSDWLYQPSDTHDMFSQTLLHFSLALANRNAAVFYPQFCLPEMTTH